MNLRYVARLSSLLVVPAPNRGPRDIYVYLHVGGDLDR